MTEDEIAETLESELAAYNLVVQVAQQGEVLLITLNRPVDSNLYYTALTEVITARIKTLKLPGIRTLLLYSRVLGEYDIDWHTQLELISPLGEQISQELQQAASSEAPPQEFKLSDYCFTRNKSLLTSELIPPSEKIARLVQFFHALPNSSKERILPIIEPFFHSSTPTEQFDLEVQQWVEQLSRLNDSEARKASIWFSRYCFNPEKTMAEVMAVLEPETVEATTASDSQQPAISSPPGQTPQRNPQAPTRTNIPVTTAKSANWQRLALPIGWLIFVVIVITLAVRSVNPSELVDTACRNTTGSQKYCRLAVQLVGEFTFHELSQNSVPLTRQLRFQSLEQCTLLVNIRAGKTFKESLETSIPVLSSFGEEVVPGIFVADIKQTNFKEGGAIRMACVFRNTKTSIPRLGTDVIPNSWPSEPYKSKPINQETLRKALGIYNVLIMLGTGTLFTAIGIFIVTTFGLGIQIDSLETLVKAALFLGIIEVIIATIPLISSIPILSLAVAIAIESLALGLVSGVVKGFYVDWSAGYPIVAAGAIAIITVRYILNLALFGFIASLVH